MRAVLHNPDPNEPFDWEDWDEEEDNDGWCGTPDNTQEDYYIEDVLVEVITGN